MSKNPLVVLKENTPTLIKIAGIVTSKNETEVEHLITSELGFLRQRFDLEPALHKCQPESLLNCVKQSIRDNLTLNKTAGLVYIYPQNVNISPKGQSAKWVTVANYEPSPDGRISIARQTGRILDLTRPKVIKDASGKAVGGSIELLKPSTPSPRWEVIEFDIHDINKWAKFSKKKNKGYANALYTSENGGIDPEFLRAKIVKHSLKKMGVNTNEIEKIKEIKIEPMFSAEINETATEVPVMEIPENVDPDTGEIMTVNPNAKFWADDL